MALKTFDGGEQFQPAIAYTEQAPVDRPDGPITAGFNQYDGGHVAYPQSDGAPIDRHITTADAPSVSQGGETAPAAGRFQRVSRHVI
jgi:hypothetical protein